MPLGLIIDPNTANPSQSDVWLLVTNGVVVNAIECDATEMTTTFAASYDYCVDSVVQGQTTAGIGWTYDPTSDTFTAPPTPPFDWVAQVQADFDGIASAITGCLEDAGSGGGNLSSTDLATAYSYSLSDSESTFSPNQLTLMNAVYAYILSGG